MPATELHDFIWQHRDDDPRRLALAAPRHPDLPMPFVAAQVAALQKIRAKIPAWHRQGLVFPLAVSVEQASSEATARFKAGLFSGKKLADLTGGLGVDVFFLAQQFESAIYVEQNADLLAAVRQNFAQLGAANVRFEQAEASQFLQSTAENFDLIYLDPARRDGAGGRVFRLEDCSPNVLAIKDLMLEKSPRALLKTAPMLDLRLAAEQLRNVARIWVVAHEGDCREVLYLLEHAAPPVPDIPIAAVSLAADGSVAQAFEFSFAEEQAAETECAAPRQYLYEPNPAVLKAGAFRTFARRFGLQKLHANTHLYTSENPMPDAPARIFRIENVCKYDRKTVLAALPEARANVSARNFPDGAEAVRKKLGLRDGGNAYLFAATIAGGEKAILICRKT